MEPNGTIPIEDFMKILIRKLKRQANHCYLMLDLYKGAVIGEKPDWMLEEMRKLGEGRGEAVKRLEELGVTLPPDNDPLSRRRHKPLYPVP